MSEAIAVPAAVPHTSQPAEAAPQGSRRDWLLAVSLANFLFFEFWHEILFARPIYVPRWTWLDVTAVALNVALLTFLLAGLIRWLRTGRFQRWQLQRYLFLVTPIICFYLFRLKYSEWLRSTLGRGLLRDVVVALLALAVIYAFYRWRARMLHGAELFTLWLLAFVPMTFSQAAWVVARQPVPPRPAALLERSASDPRVVLIVFDEFDFIYAFHRRPSDLQLPAFDRLRSETFSAEMTYQVASQTKHAIPSMTTGRAIKSSAFIGPDDLLLKQQEGEPLRWREHNMFRDARALGANIGIAGWYLPYCRIFEESVSRCYWEPKSIRPVGENFFQAVWNRMQLLSPLEDRQRQIIRYGNLMRESKPLVRDPRLDLVFLHMTVPHPPSVFDRHQKEFTVLPGDEAGGYFGNLALADQGMAELRSEMEAAGLWQDSVVIVTSDHDLRPSIEKNGRPKARVPLFIKLPGNQAGEKYFEAVNNHVTNALVLSLMKGEIKDTAGLRNWLATHPATILPETKQ